MAQRLCLNHLPVIEGGLQQWMEECDYESVREMLGSMSQLRYSDPGAFERAQYTRAVKGLATRAADRSRGLESRERRIVVDPLPGGA
jgi:hypothetical protein